MKHTTLIPILATSLALSGASFAYANEAKGSIDTSMKAEIQLFQAAKISLAKAGEVATGAVPGQLASVGFNDENGTGVYEAVVIAKDGTVSMVKVDATSGALLAKGPVASMGDENDGDKQDNKDSSEDSEAETD